MIVAKKSQQKNKVKSKKQENNLQIELDQLREQLLASQEKEKRALADYQNLIRRTGEERSFVVKMANKDLIKKIIPTLSNLHRACQQLDDQGLILVADQLEQTLKEFGLEEIKVKGQSFDVNTMEAVDKRDDGEQVVEVMQKGYCLKGEVVQHAKVILGEK
ncbi:MAG: nucleotide exchange factor GrpE [Patescibacteria group bacterium]|nr:nucleotide exchange factor GrpE [Patescibacteria group bacterium]